MSSLFLIGFGLVFQIPLIIFVLVMFGVVTPETLGRYRRHAFVAIIVIAAMITPTGDPINLMIMAVPMYILFEIGLWVSRIFLRKRTVPEQEQEQITPSDPPLPPTPHS